MRKSQIKVGGLYQIITKDGPTTVRVNDIKEISQKTIASKEKGTRSRPYTTVTCYDVFVLEGGARLEFRSAAKFLKEVTLPNSPATLYLGPLESTDEAVAAAVAAHDEEASKEADPTPSVPTATTGPTPAPVEYCTGEEPDCCEGDTGSAQDGVCAACGKLIREDEQCSDPTTVKSTDQGGQLTPALSVAPSIPAVTNGLAARIAATRTGRQVGTPVAGMVPNEEQEAILEVAAQQGLKALVISAGAGTGKTATLKMLEQVLRGRGQYTAFNKALVEESKAKFTKASVATTHSLAFRAVGRRYSHRLGGERMRSGQVARILQIEPLLLEMQGEVDSQGLPRTKTLSAEFLAGQVLVAVRRFCQSADPCIGRRHLKWIDGIDPVVGDRVSRENQEIVREYLGPFLKRAWEDLCHLEGRLPFDHDVYVKIWGLGQGVDRPVISADYILLDEAQDTAPVFLDIIQQQKHALLVMVGDENQQIYEWRGAVNAMAAFQGAPRRVLSQSYRFGQTIADVANTILGTLEEPTDLVMRGMPGMPSRVAELERADCYLYRTNAGAVGRVMLSLKEGLRPHLIGGGADVVRWCQAAIDLKATGKTSHPELCCFDSWGEVEEYSKTDEGQDIRLMVKLIKEFTAEAIRDALRDMPDEASADLVVSTVHKSKGREWDTVKLGPDFPTANKMQDSDRRLLYVGATRAKLTLDISECPPFCGARSSGENSAEGGGAWVPGLEVEYTVPMPTFEEQEEWYRHRGAKHVVSAMVGAGYGQHTMVPIVLSEEKRHQEVVSKMTVKFTWCKYDDKWCARGPINTPVGTKVEVERRDGSKQAATIREVVKEYPDAWIYRI